MDSPLGPGDLPFAKECIAFAISEEVNGAFREAYWVRGQEVRYCMFPSEGCGVLESSSKLYREL